MTWSLLLLGLACSGVYVGLLLERRVSPPIVPIDSGNRLRGYATGDAVLLRDVTAAELERGDVVAVRAGGTIVAEVETVDQQGARTWYRVVGGRPGDALLVPRSDVIGRADRKVPVAGWLLLAARSRPVQLLGGALLLGLIGLFVAGRRSPLAFLEVPREPLEAGPAPLALGPATDGPMPTPDAELAYVAHPMSITPDDLRQVRFAQQRKGGYDTEAVDRALDTVADSLEGVYQERQQLVDRLRALEAEVERYKAMETQLGQTLATAERTAAQVVAEAQAEADRILAGVPAAATAPGPSTPGVQDGTMVELLGETRAIRSLLQAVLAQGGGLPGRPPA